MNPLRRRFKLSELNPHWVIFHGKEGDSPDAIYFDCPEGHEGCGYVMPFSPALDGTPRSSTQRVVWDRDSATSTFENLTISPSFRRIQRYATKEEALKDGCLEQYITEALLCRLHIFIKNGRIEFCADSQ